MENTEKVTEAMETLVEEGAEKVLEITPKKIAAVLGATAIAGGIVYLIWKKKPWKKDSKDENVVDVEVTEKEPENSAEPEKMN